MPRTDHRRRNRPPSLARPLRFEALENRRMLSITVTNLDDAGPGSLRAAIVQANDEAGPEAIWFDAAMIGTIELSSGELTITDTLTINGPARGRITIDANEQSRVFNIDDGTASRIDVEIRGVAITGGRTTGDGGGIFSRENLTVTNSNISDNSADGMGGAIFISLAELTIDYSIISGNTAAGGGGIHAAFDRINPGDEVVTVTGSTISGNTASGDVAGYGGGVFAYAVTVTDSTISGNTANFIGGVFAHAVTVTDSTISGNHARRSGGGIGGFGGLTSRVTVTVTNSSVSGNTAAERGGGIFASSNEGVVTVTAL